MSRPDNIGFRAEQAAMGALATPLDESQEEYFNVTHLGDKWPTIDLLAEVPNADNKPYFCLLQVKGTTTKPQASGNLNISIDAATLARLANYPAPTYLVAVDLSEEAGYLPNIYLLAITPGMVQGYTSFPTTFELTVQTLRLLRDEVIAYWSSPDVARHKESFTSNFSPQ